MTEDEVIAEQSIAKGGDYVLRLKGNLRTRQESVEEFFVAAIDDVFAGVAYDYTERSGLRITDVWKSTATGSPRT